MRMRIENIISEKDSLLVEGITSIGRVCGVWRYNEKPILGECYNFELDIEALEDEKVIVLNDDKNISTEVYIDKDKVFFKGIVEQIDDIYVVRFSGDWIEMIEIEHDNHRINTGDCIKFYQTKRKMSIFPYD